MSRFAFPIQACRALIVFSLMAVLICNGVSVPAFAADSAAKLFKIGQKAEDREDYDAAYEAYKKAYAKTPNDLRMRTAYYRLRQTASSTHVTQGKHLLSQGDEQGALTQFLRATEIDPGNEAALQEIAKIRSKENGTPLPRESSISDSSLEEIADSGAPPLLRPISTEPLTLHMTADSKVVYQAIGKAAGINVLFDSEYSGKGIQVDLLNVTLMDALRIVSIESNTFWRPVTNNTIFVAANSRSKHTELDEQAVQTFYLSNAWQQNDLNDVVQALRNVMANAHAYGVPSQNAIVMRGTPDELTLAQKIINDLDKARPEVVVDVAIMEVDKDKLRNIGLSWPGSVSFALQPPQSSTSTTTTTTTGTATNTTNLTLDNLANLNANNFAVTVGAATANLLVTDSDTKILQNPRIRALDGQKATLKIGSKIPVATGSYQTGATTAITSSLVNTQFQYQDVGVKIEMTPTVHYDHDVTLKLAVEDTSESGQVTISGVTEPIIAQKTSEQTIRLKEGEATILAGILNKQDLISSSGIPGLGELPLLRYIFGSKSVEHIDDEVVFVLIPHVVRSPDITPLNLRSIDTGNGQGIALRPVMQAPEAKPAAGATGVPNAGQAPAPRPVQPSSSVGPLQGQTAAAATASALQQMRQGSVADVPRVTAPSPAGEATPANASPAESAAAPGAMTFQMSAPLAPITTGSTFQVPVAVTGGKDVASVPLRIQYDASKLSLVNVNSGDFLVKNGQLPALVHGDAEVQGTSLHSVSVVGSLPPGAPGKTGSGVVFVLTFQAKQAGESQIVITHPGAMDSAQKPIQASAQPMNIVVH